MLALVGLVAAALGKGLGRTRRGRGAVPRHLHAADDPRLLCLPYKTPWCALGFLHGMILLAGVGAAVLVRVMPGRVLKFAAVTLLLAAAGHLGRQAHQASFVALRPMQPLRLLPHDRDILPIVDRVKQIAAAHPDGTACTSRSSARTTTTGRCPGICESSIGSAGSTGCPAGARPR